MKYLKLYENFLGGKTDFNSDHSYIVKGNTIEQDIKDMFLELSDLGYELGISWDIEKNRREPDIHIKFYLRIELEGGFFNGFGNSFQINDDIKDFIFRCVDYSKYYSYVYVTTVDLSRSLGGLINPNTKESDILNHFSELHSLSFHPTLHIRQIKFELKFPLVDSLKESIFNNKEQSEILNELKDECNDILQEVKDMGLELLVDISSTHPLRRMRVIIFNKNSLKLKEKIKFKYSDIKPHVEHLISFLESNGYTLNYNFGKYSASVRGIIHKQDVSTNRFVTYNKPVLLFKNLNNNCDDIEIDELDILFLLKEDIPKHALLPIKI